MFKIICGVVRFSLAYHKRYWHTKDMKNTANKLEAMDLIEMAVALLPKYNLREDVAYVIELAMSELANCNYEEFVREVRSALNTSTLPKQLRFLLSEALKSFGVKPQRRAA